MNNLGAKIRVIVGALPTWLAIATSVLTILAAEVVPELPGDTQAQVAGWIAAGIAILAAAIAVIRKLTPVLDPSQWGLLPKPPYGPNDPNNPNGDAGEVSLELVVVVIALCILVLAAYHLLFHN